MDRRQLLAGAIGAAVCSVVGIDTADAAIRPGVHVYLVKGTLGLSPGIDELAEKFKRRGIHATVHDLGETDELAAEATRRYRTGRERQIVLIGHSMGGSAILVMAEQLDRAGVPVALAIPLDAPSAVPVPGNVRRVINFYLSTGMGVAVARSAKFRGSLRNVDLKNDPQMGHFAISSSEKIHREVIGYVLGAISEPAPPASRTPEPAPSQQQQANAPR
jgi:hypothetical protein